MKLNPDDIQYAQWETEGGTTPEQNENHFAALAVSDDCPKSGVEFGESNLQAEIT